MQTGEFTDPTGPARVRALLRTLGEGRPSADNIEAARRQIADLIRREVAAQQIALLTFASNAKVELFLAAGALLVLPGTALLVLAILRERISRPLQDLNNLLALIGEGRSSAELEDVGVPLRPIMESYNRLVDQLADALSQNREYQGRLESEVRAAAGTLIRQQLELAEADRLAAVGEISARVAHELKNPLAGIQMALSNLKDDIDVPDQLNRLQLVADEVARMARLLDQLLVHPHRSPEPCQDTEICTLVADLLALLRYQISGRILLKNGVDPAARWRLQRDVLRQVLLNLVLNAAQAIGESAGAIEVTAAREGRALRLSIMDDGPGFPPDVLADGIRPFQTSRSGGMGLGLSTVERMVRAMGGRIELSNREPRGAIASVLLGSTRVQ
jgi:C4-dicarboxylate-specific signal transduction histidine kinase